MRNLFFNDLYLESKADLAETQEADHDRWEQLYRKF